MSSIQNSCHHAKTFLEPVAFLGLAFLAGRFVEYFPTASQNGLLLSAASASLATTLYQCALHDEMRSDLTILLLKGALIGLATIGTGFAAKTLEGRANISFADAAKMGAAQFVISALITQATAPSALQREHLEYQLNPRLWIRLSSEERTEKAKAFAGANLPALSLENAKISKKDFPQPPSLEEWEKLSPGVLSWTLAAHGIQDADLLMPLFKLSLDKGIQPDLFQVDDQAIQYFKDNGLIDLLYNHMKAHPQYFYAHKEANRKEMMEQLFQGKGEIPKVDATISARQFATQPLPYSFMWMGVILDEKRWGEVPEATRLAATKHMLLYSNQEIDLEVYQGLEAKWLAELTQEEIQDLNKHQAKVCHDLMSKHKETIKGDLSAEQLAAFNSRFKYFNWGEI
ncbi:MAG: hypothetical protein AB7N99_06150 [Simkaniaceae bacterium]